MENYSKVANNVNGQRRAETKCLPPEGDRPLTIEPRPHFCLQKDLPHDIYIRRNCASSSQPNTWQASRMDFFELRTPNTPRCLCFLCLCFQYCKYSARTILTTLPTLLTFPQLHAILTLTVTRAHTHTQAGILLADYHNVCDQCKYVCVLAKAYSYSFERERGCVCVWRELKP